MKEQHDEYGFGKFRRCVRQEADAECAEGGDGHQKVFVEHIAMQDTFTRFFQGVMSDKQVGNKIDQ
ncbi:MAG: hypothetical protein MR298_10520 [Odoribacter sp.]|nr:hypothetical protein [Odoribacter sp.]MDY3033004.1 hypothetical protein [Odoribacter sp.]